MSSIAAEAPQNSKVVIVVTEDKAALARAWSADWAEKHSGRYYEAIIDGDGWAVTDAAKFPPATWQVVEPKKKPPRIDGKGVLRRITNCMRSDGGYSLFFDCGHSTRRQLSAERGFIGHWGLFNGYCKKCAMPNLYPTKLGYVPLPVGYYVYQEGAFWSLTPEQWFNLCKEAARNGGAYALNIAPLKSKPAAIKGSTLLGGDLHSEDVSRPLKRPLGNDAAWFEKELALVKK